MATVLPGRSREIGELGGVARKGGLVTLLGGGGTGKTRLLKALLAAVAGEFPGGTFRVDLGDLRRPDLVAPRVAAALRVSEEPGVPLADTLASALRGRRAVLALDSCEHLTGACADLGQRLLAGSPELLVVAASRVALGAAGETVWEVPPLDRPDPGERDPERAARSGAVRLFVARARDARQASAWRRATARPWRRSARPRAACRWPSSWPRHGSATWMPARSPTGWVTRHRTARRCEP